MPPHRRQPSGRGQPSAKELDLLTRLYGERRYDEAQALSESLTRNFPRHPFGWKVLGVIHQAQNRYDESLLATQRAIALQPNDAATHSNLGTTLLRLNRPEEAKASFLRSLRIAPNYVKALSNLGALLFQEKQLPEAEAYCRRALDIDPNYPKALHNLGSILETKGELIEASACFRRALDLDPNELDPLLRLCLVLVKLDATAEAKSLYRYALERFPDNSALNNNYANLLQDEGYLSEAQPFYRKALEHNPGWAEPYSNLLFCMDHDVMVDPQTLFAAHLTFGDKFETPLRPHWQPHHNTKDAARQLKVGFVSGDFYSHVVAPLVEPVLKRLSALDDLSLYAYYTRPDEDRSTENLRACFPHWRAAAKLNDGELADQIRADGIDILIDLSGHTALNRLLAFARKPAPIQATWLGYPGSTGLKAMDYFISNPFVLSGGELGWQLTEKAVLLPATIPYIPPAHAPEISPPPCLQNGHLTFGSFNRLSKLNPAVIALWSMLLHSLPDARLLIGGSSLDSRPALIQSFAAQGIDAGRLLFAPRMSMAEYLTMHNQIDICLDTYPYGGGTTSINALWMGVPTLTLAGETFPSRAGGGFMNQLGLPQFIASSIEDFVAKGAYWSDHMAELATIRASMRDRFAAAPIGQPDLIASSLHRALRTMWQRWCNDLPPDLIDTTRH